MSDPGNDPAQMVGGGWPFERKPVALATVPHAEIDRLKAELDTAQHLIAKLEGENAQLHRQIEKMERERRVENQQVMAELVKIKEKILALAD